MSLVSYIFGGGALLAFLIAGWQTFRVNSLQGDKRVLQSVVDLSKAKHAFCETNLEQEKAAVKSFEKAHAGYVKFSDARDKKQKHALWVANQEIDRLHKAARKCLDKEAVRKRAGEMFPRKAGEVGEF